MDRSLGELPPRIVCEPPGPASRNLGEELRRCEAPGINTVYLGEPGLLWREAAGSNVVDVDGNRFVDLTSGFGVAAIGHRHPSVVEAIRRQSLTLVHGLGDVMAHPARVELTGRLVALFGRTFPGSGPPKVHLAVSGSDAVEIAAKTALLHQRRAHRHRDRSTLAVFDPAYHGLSLGALALTSRPAFRVPFAGHLHPHLERFAFGAPLDAFESRLERGDVAAVVLEPIVGREGVVVPPDGWLAELSAACRRTETLLVADEIFTGFGRTGRMFAVEHWEVVPDLVCCGKALGGGLPIGAVVGAAEILDAWSTDGEALHTGTFVGHPLACAAALAALDVLEDEALVERAERLGSHLGARLAEIGSAQTEQVEAVRGMGLLQGMVLRDDQVAGRLVAAARRRGILLLAGGPEGRVAQIVPPLTIDPSLLDLALDLLTDALAAV